MPHCARALASPSLRSVSLALVLLATAVLAAPTSADTNLGTVGGVRYMHDQDDLVGGFPNIGAPVADCPGGTQVVGGGADAVEGGTDGRLLASYPIDDSDDRFTPDDAWRAYTFNTSGADADAEAYAMCLENSRSRYVRDEVTFQGPGSEAHSVRCSSGRVAAGGAHVSGASGSGWISTSIGIDGNDSDQAPDDGWRVKAYGSQSQQTLSAWAICLRGLRVGYQRAAFTSNVNAAFAFEIPCGRGHLLGGGVAVAGDLLQRTIEAMLPIDGGDKGKVPDDGMHFNGAAPAPVAANAMVSCLK